LQYNEQRTLWRHILAEGSPYILQRSRDVMVQVGIPPGGADCTIVERTGHSGAKRVIVERSGS